jgi:NTP pyrophosphatase (non-canonical NTP hydrolase)
VNGLCWRITMQIKEYCEKAKRTCADLRYREKDNIHMIFGMLTEIGELADIYKKNLAYKKEVDEINAKEELGDIMWYVANYCNINGFNLEEILDINIAKLEARYPDKFTEKKAINRNLDLERQILEQ